MFIAHVALPPAPFGEAGISLPLNLQKPPAPPDGAGNVFVLGYKHVTAAGVKTLVFFTSQNV